MRLELLISLPGRVLFRTTTARTFAQGADFRPGNHAFHLKLLLVSFASGSNDSIPGQRQLAALEVFLQKSFGILAEGMSVQLPQRGSEKNFNCLLGLLKTRIKIYGANHSFQRIRKNRRPFVSSAFEFTFAKSDKLSQLKRLRQLSQHLLVYEVRPYPRQAAFAEVGKMMEYQSGDGTVEDSVAKKFKPFVVRQAVAAVRQRLSQQFGLTEGVTEFPAQRRTFHIPVSCSQFCASPSTNCGELISRMLKVRAAARIT